MVLSFGGSNSWCLIHKPSKIIIRGGLLMLKDKIILYINGFGSLRGIEIAEEFYQLFLEVEKELIPQKISNAGSKKSGFDRTNIKEIWIEAEKQFAKYSGNLNGGIVDFYGRDSLYYEICWTPNGFNNISLRITENTLKQAGVNSFIDLIKKLFIAINGFYGYCYHPSQRGVHYTPGLNYETCIGGITWMALFGPPYVDMFGIEVLKSTPCWVEEFAKDRFILLTSEEPMETTPEILERQELVKKHLGEEVFFRHDEEAKRPKIYTIEEMMAGKDLPNKEGYRHPDFSKFLKEYNKEGADVKHT
jgi:hypothetical protein